MRVILVLPNGDDMELNSAGGCRFGSHNVDGPDQQLTLIAGLAALFDLFRKDFTKK
jgi:hypothetical protein